MNEIDEIIVGCKKYISEILTKKVELEDYIDGSTILLNVYAKVWDLMILLDNDLFKYEFTPLYSEHFVVDDHKHEPPIFSRVKSYKWLTENFAKRLPVALWIFQNIIVIQEKGNLFQQIITEQKDKFNQNFQGITKRKYLELRSDRHNLRRSAMMPNDMAMANALLKANVVKLCFELSLLADGKPYPFRILLPDFAKNNATNGYEVFLLSQEFLATTDPEATILLSDKLIEYTVAALQKMKLYSEDFLLKWWLYLD